MWRRHPKNWSVCFPQLEILSFVGWGGMGAVYKARQKALDRVVALKILPPGIGGDPAFAERFAREAKALAKLNHPGIVTLYEFGQADGLFYFLMEFVDGVNLRHLLEAERLSPREALAIVPQICDALQYAHDQGIVHRDIKPENILLDRQGRVKVADFGLAKLVEMDAGRVPVTPSLTPCGVEGAPVLTEAGSVMGTPQYMAPEQREHPTEVDHRADIYSLGVVFYQMLTGELPGKPIEPPSHTVRVDVRLDEVVLRALEKEPERRYQHVSQMKSAVETISQSCPPADANPQPADWRTWSWFQSQQVREIIAHMTEAERREWSLRGALFGIWNAATFFVPCGIALFITKPLNWIYAAIVLLVGLAFYPLWQRMAREFLAATKWARQQRIMPESLRMSPQTILVGRRGDNAVIHWRGVLLRFVMTLVLLILLLVAVGAISAYRSSVLVGWIDSRWVGIAFVSAVIFTGILVRRGLRTPIEQLTPLDEPSETGPRPAVEEQKRTGRKVVLSFLAAAVGIGTLGAWIFLPGGRLPTGGATLAVVAMLFITIFGAALAALGSRGKAARSHAVWPWIVAVVGMVLLVPVVLITGFYFVSYSRTEGTVRAVSPNHVLEVRCEGPMAYIQAELDDRHELRLFIGSEALGWSFQHTGSTSVTATVEASSQIKMEDGSMGRGLIFQVWGSRAYIAITPEGPVPYGEVVFRPNSRIANESGSFTFADIRQSDDTLVLVSIRVRPVSGKSSGSQSFGPVIERVIATSDADNQGLVFFDMETGKSFKPPWALTLRPNRGPTFVDLTPELQRWIKARDVDVLLHLGDRAWDLMTLEMQEDFAGQLNEWETIAPEKVVGMFAKKDADHLVRIRTRYQVEYPDLDPLPLFAKQDADHLVRDAVPASSFGHSYRDGFGSFSAFRTRSNTLGVNQFEGVEKSTGNGVRIRYKLVQTASGPNVPALESALEYRTALVTKGTLTQAVTATGTLNPLPNDPAKWRINALVDEADIVRVDVGQAVAFTHGAFPDRVFHGKVVQIGTKAVTVQSVVCYEANIEVPSAESTFKPGMTANLQIIVAQREDVLTIPNAALRFRLPGSAANAARSKPGSDRTVYVMRDDGRGQSEPVRIKTGISDGSFTEITEGLKEGERVVTGFRLLTTNSAAEAARMKTGQGQFGMTGSRTNSDPHSSVTGHAYFCQGKPRAGLEGWEKGWKVEADCLVNTGAVARISTKIRFGKEDLAVSASLSLDELKGTGAAFTFGNGYAFEFDRPDKRFAVSGLPLVRSRLALPANVIVPGKRFVFSAERRGPLLDFFIDDKLIQTVQYEGEIGAIGFDPKKATMRIYGFGASQMYPQIAPKAAKTPNAPPPRANSRPSGSSAATQTK
ncbi:MAG: protein kinase domain-containing protein [Pirellulales bacterium]